MHAAHDHMHTALTACLWTQVLQAGVGGREVGVGGGEGGGGWGREHDKGKCIWWLCVPRTSSSSSSSSRRTMT